MKPESKSAVRFAAFTLIELLVVIAIIAILGAILIPAVSKVRQRAHVTQATSSLRNVFSSLNLYANEHGDTYPGPLWFWQYGRAPSNESGQLADYLAPFLRGGEDDLEASRPLPGYVPEFFLEELNDPANKPKIYIANTDKRFSHAGEEQSIWGYAGSKDSEGGFSEYPLTRTRALTQLERPSDFWLMKTAPNRLSRVGEPGVPDPDSYGNQVGTLYSDGRIEFSELK